MNPNNANLQNSSAAPAGGDRLWQYVQQLAPDAIAQLSQPSLEAAQLMEGHLQGMLGTLPSEHFNVSITTSREHLGQLMSAAMLQGYFLHAAEQRLQIERSWQEAAALEG